MRSKKAIGQNGTSHSGGVSQVGSRSCRAMPRKPPGLRGKTAQRSLERSASVACDREKARQRRSGSGTFETCPSILRMSAHRARPEVGMIGSNRRE